MKARALDAASAPGAGIGESIAPTRSAGSDGGTVGVTGFGGDANFEITGFAGVGVFAGFDSCSAGAPRVAGAAGMDGATSGRDWVTSAAMDGADVRGDGAGIAGVRRVRGEGDSTVLIEGVTADAWLFRARGTRARCPGFVAAEVAATAVLLARARGDADSSAFASVFDFTARRDDAGASAAPLFDLAWRRTGFCAAGAAAKSCGAAAALDGAVFRRRVGFGFSWSSTR